MPTTPLSYGPENRGFYFIWPEFLRWEIAKFEGLQLSDFDDLPGPVQSRWAARYELANIKARLLAGGIHGG